MYRLLLYYRTLRHVRLAQFFYYLYYAFLRRTRLDYYDKDLHNVTAFPLVLDCRPSPESSSLDQAYRFTFLNKSVLFPESIDWNYKHFGKLWTYNLNYFDFIHQQDLPVDFKLRLVQDYLTKSRQLKDGIEPYCISLRNINLIFFLSEHSIHDQNINSLIWQHYRVLLKNLEYHLGANHLLENACSLVVGAVYFRSNALYKRGCRLLTAQLQEQIFADGGHYERSPMYHMILLGRLLDVANVLKNNAWFHQQDSLYHLLKEKAGLMMRWALNMSCGNRLPAFHDSINSKKTSVLALSDYAQRLGVNVPEVALKDSNYRRFEAANLSLIIDVGMASPSYQPGHYHAGIFNFVLYVQGLPCIVDPGVSTYENNKRRHFERGTMAHNTITVNRMNQSEVWSSFRVGKRAYVNLEEDRSDILVASHNGYSNLGLTHRVTLNNLQHAIVMKHEVIGKVKSDTTTRNELRIHFHPSLTPQVTQSGVAVEGLLNLELTHASFLLEDYYFADDFNVTRNAKVLVISISEWCCLTVRSV